MEATNFLFQNEHCFERLVEQLMSMRKNMSHTMGKDLEAKSPNLSPLQDLCREVKRIDFFKKKEEEEI